MNREFRMGDWVKTASGKVGRIVRGYERDLEGKTRITIEETSGWRWWSVVTGMERVSGPSQIETKGRENETSLLHS